MNGISMDEEMKRGAMPGQLPDVKSKTVTAGVLYPEDLLHGVTEALSAKKGKNLCVLDISKITTVATYFVIATGTSSTHIRALADAVEDRMRQTGLQPYRRSGYGSARWILLDYSDVVVHVFHEEDRAFYGLERLWQDAEFLTVES